jgi:hypothetical protein
MARLGELADEQVPLLTDLQRAAPDLNLFFKRLGPFSEASRPALRSLGEASEKGSAAFREGAQEVDELRRLAKDAPSTFKNFRQYLETMDDRRRALENDPRAKEGSPPPPDPTAITGEGGFTGLEAIWNFIFWSGMSLNGFDGLSHILRVSVTATPCTPLQTDIDENHDGTVDQGEQEHFDQCKQWLGPNLPGITTPDFTSNRSRLARLRRESSRPASRVGERRSEGQPDAAPVPGQRDISRPQIVLPPQVQQLIDDLSPKERLRLPNGPQIQDQVQGGGSGQSSGQLLDFLLGQ